MKCTGICTMLSVVLLGEAVALTRPYAVEPQTAAQSGRAKLPSYVGQYVVCTWDSLSYPGRVELFTGDVGGDGTYDLNVRDSATNERLAYKYGVTPKGDHQWLKFDTLDISGPFVRGRTVLFSFGDFGDTILNSLDIEMVPAYAGCVWHGEFRGHNTKLP